MRGTITITPASDTRQTFLLPAMVWLALTALAFSSVVKVFSLDNRAYAVAMMIWIAVVVGGTFPLRKLFFRFHPELDKEPEKARASFSLNGFDGHIYIGTAGMKLLPDGKTVLSIDIAMPERFPGVVIG